VKDPADAERSFSRAVKIAEDAAQMKLMDRVEVLASAAEFYAFKKRYGEAEPLLRHAVELAAGPPPAEKLFQLRVRERLAELLREEGKDEEANRLVAEPLPASGTTQAGPDWTEAAHDSQRARQYKEQGNLQEAEVFFRRAISVFEKVPTAGMPLATDLEQLADICHSDKRDAEAEELYRRAMDVREKSLTPKTATNARILSFPFAFQNFLRDQGRLDEIEPVYQRALAVQEKYLGPTDDSIADTLRMLASVYRENGNSQAALPLCQRALLITERNRGQDDPSVAAILDEYARNLEALGRTPEASATRTRAEKIRSKKASLR